MSSVFVAPSSRSWYVHPTQLLKVIFELQAQGGQRMGLSGIRPVAHPAQVCAKFPDQPLMLILEQCQQLIDRGLIEGHMDGPVSSEWAGFTLTPKGHALIGAK